MADEGTFVMCTNSDCINKDNCVRYTVKPSSYFHSINFKQICTDGNDYKQIIINDKNIPIKKLIDVLQDNIKNNDNMEGEKIIGDTNSTQDIQENQKQESKEGESI